MPAGVPPPFPTGLQIEDVQTHPSFDITTYLGDIAVVKLAGTFTPAEAIRMGIYPAKLGTPDMLTLGTQLTLSGWGVTNTVVPPEGDVNGDAGPDTTSDAVHGADDDWALDASPSLHAGSDDDENSSEDSGLGVGHDAAIDAGEGGSEVSPAPEVTDDDYYFYAAGRWADDAVAAAGRPAPVLHRPVDAPVRAGGDVVVTPAPAVRMETLSKPGTLLTTKVFSQPMDKCSTFAEEVIGVSNYSTSFYDEALEVCLSLNDMVAACDGDRCVGSQIRERGGREVAVAPTICVSMHVRSSCEAQSVLQETGSSRTGRRCQLKKHPTDCPLVVCVGLLDARSLFAMGFLYRRHHVLLHTLSGSPFFTQAPHPQGFYSYFVHAIMSVRLVFLRSVCLCKRSFLHCEDTSTL